MRLKDIDADDVLVTGWVEPSTLEEKRDDPTCPYRLCFESGARFGLSVNDAVRAQKMGCEYRPKPSVEQWAELTRNL